VGHGTHTAGTIAAAANGIGIVGVAPNVKIAAIKAGNSDNLFFPEAVVCAFYWAGSHHIDVTNNSYFADPWRFNCRNDEQQRAIWKAEQRAIRYAMSQGVTVIASLGNENQDYAHPTIDDTSPDFPGPPITREVTNACAVVPVEIAGVIGVSANGDDLEKALYSNYGMGVVQVVAPGGAFFPLLGIFHSRVLSTYPAALFNPASSSFIQDCSVSPCAIYRYLQGTSMAAPHVAGVAALIISKFGKMPPGKVQAFINQTADPLPCPPNPFLGGTEFEANCKGGIGDNSFYGHGQVNALGAILHAPGP
jgi:subtilisin family serine protease